MSNDPNTGQSGSRERVRTGRAAVAGLWCLAVVQPVLDLFGRTPAFLVAHDLDGWRLLAYVATLVLAGPILFVVVDWVLCARGHDRFAELMRAASMVVLGALLALLVLRRVPMLPGWLSALLAVTAGVASTRFFGRSAVVRQLLSLAGVLSLFAVPADFLTGAPIRRLVDAGGTVAEALAGQVPAGKPVPVVLAVLDELPLSTLLRAPRAIDESAFPHWARIAATATWYPRATTVANSTMQAVPAILTGAMPRAGQLPSREDHPRNLLTVLGATHDVQSLEPLTRLGPADARSRAARPSTHTLAHDTAIVYLHVVLPEPWTRWLPPITGDWSGFGDAGDRASDILSFLDGLEETARPSVVFFHSLLPHHPWTYLPSGRRYDTGDEIFIDGLADEVGGSLYSNWSEDAWAVAQAYQRHVLQAMYADRLLGALADRLQALGLWHDALVVVTSDHGIHFAPGGPVRALEPASAREVGRVPLLVKYPGQTLGAVDERPATVLDIVPTVADVLALPLDPSPAGHSLRGPSAAAPAPEAPPLGVFGLKQLLFGDTRIQDPFRVGPFRDALYGRPLGPQPKEPCRRAVVDRPSRYRDHDPEAAMVPARVTGHLLPTDEHDDSTGPAPVLALTLNGVVRGLTRVRDKPGRPGFFAFMVPEEAFTSGANALALYLVRQGDEGISIEPVGVDDTSTYQLVEEGSTAALVASDGSRYAITPDRFGGRAAALTFEAMSFRVEIFGWSVGAQGARPVQIVATVDGRSVASTDLNYRRSPMQPRYVLEGPRADVGFVLYLPIEQADGQLRLFALGDDGTAAELPVERRTVERDGYNGPFGL